MPDARCDSCVMTFELGLQRRIVLHCIVLYCTVYTICRYFVGVDWQPKKLDVEVEVPLTLDLEGMRSKGMQVLLSIGSVRSLPSSGYDSRAVPRRWGKMRRFFDVDLSSFGAGVPLTCGRCLMIDVIGVVSIMSGNVLL